MTFFGAAWGLRRLGLTPIAKLVAIRLGDSCDVEAKGKAEMEDLIEWCCAARSEILEALELLATAEDVRFWLDGDDVVFELPTEAKPTHFSARDRPDPPATIYIMRGKLGLKVGITRNLQARVTSLRYATLDDTINVEWSMNGRSSAIRRIERRAHEILSPHLIKKEWFDVSLEQAKAAVVAASNEIMQKPE